MAVTFDPSLNNHALLNSRSRLRAVF